MLRTRSALPYALVLAALIAGCSGSDDRAPLLSQVDPLEIPAADTTTRTNINVSNPTLTVPTTFEVSDGDTLTLVWSDEFDGAQLDPDVWFFEEGDGSQYGIPGWGNNERQYYLPDNARLENGLLIIEARRETVGDYGFTSARITTQDRLAVQYGRIEARMKLPAGQGLWPAFWMLPQDVTPGSAPAAGVYGGFSASGEIDIMEAVNLGGAPGPAGFGGGNTVFGTIHFGGEFPANQFTTVEYEVPESLTAGFNDFAVEWDEFEIRWYVNNILYATQNSWFSEAAPYPAPFDQPFKILLNLAVGGNFPGEPNASTPMPATMEVDWVRIYSGEASGGSMPAEPTTSAPTPGEDPADVTSIFSDAYTDISDVDFAPNDGQATVYSPAGLSGDQFLQYAGLDFQRIDFSGNPQDVSDKGFLHVDVWTADSTELNVSISSSGQAGDQNAIAVMANSWVSVDIQLTDFGSVDLTDVTEIRFDGNGTIFVDNLYFAGDAPLPAGAGEIPDVKIVAADGSTPDLTPTFDGFGSGTTFTTDFANDFSYGNAVEVVVGAGYGGGALAQLGLTGLTPGFATSYGEFLFKVKGLNADNTIQAKLEEPFPGTSVPVQIDLTSPPANVTVTDLGDGWSQVVIGMAAYGDVSTFSQIVFQTLDGAYAVGDRLYLTDIGFNNAQASAGTLPDTSIVPADGSTPDLVAGTDFTGFEAFGTGGSNDYAFTGDSSFASVVAVTPGAGYGGGSLGQFGIVGFTPGFASAYETLLLKVKGLSDNTVVVKLEEPFPGASVPVTIDLASPPAGVTVTDLGDGWSQIEIPISSFGDVSTFSQIVIESVPGSQAIGDPFFVTDVGFIDAPGGGAADGVTPDTSIVTRDGSTPDLVLGTDFTAFEAFGTGGSNDYAFAGDSSYANAVAVTPGAGYGGGSLGQFGIVGFTPGFASAYDTLLLKVKGLSDNTVVVKIEEPFPGASVPVTVDLASPPAGVTVTDLGDGWSQVEIPISSYGDVSTFSQIVVESIPGSQAEGNPFFVTDLGFASSGASAGTTPDASIVTRDGSTPDLVLGTDFTAFEAFGTGGSNDYAFAGDSSYANAVAVTPGAGYGGGSLGQFGIVGFTPGFASAYDTLLLKVKGLSDNTVVVKIEEPFPGTSVPVTVDLAAPPAGVTVTDLGDGWSEVEIPISAYGDVSTFSQIVIESIPGSQAEGNPFFVTDLGFTTSGGGGGGTELAVNGDFETGDFTGWQEFPNGGTISIVTPGAGGTGSAASLDASGMAIGVTLKLANLGAGTLTPGQQVTVNFDWQGTDGVGGVVDVRLLSEVSGGGVSQEDQIQGGAGFPASYTSITPAVINIGPDVSGGISLQFTAICGGDPSCVSTIQIDNVSIVAN